MEENIEKLTESADNLDARAPAVTMETSEQISGQEQATGSGEAPSSIVSKVSKPETITVKRSKCCNQK